MLVSQHNSEIQLYFLLPSAFYKFVLYFKTEAHQNKMVQKRAKVKNVFLKIKTGAFTYYLQVNKKNAKELKRFKSTELEPVTNKSNSSDNEEKIYLLQREKTMLLSKIKNTKKDLSEMRDVLKNLEFKILKNPNK